ncbi:pantoate--beta-alanine ligase [Fulvimarina sp. 2208YS6-2-32]|uniref:Pantothenate synthetase n=1 Tax=Fulvimarina uroteuthidis TaxID=3098149 RepID=A0ABU5I464_9HYPH|nr:pantoate--beta-alanine ligase [Fulvimarina sp. 2208YS6-2-32]MDY8109553.1 pantoate--beta-alanine ligase [Fulvimarina sp. 2208YS6-2-32]
MQQFRRIDEVRNALEPFRAERRPIGLVPTMGALHRGHGTLIETARAQNDTVVVSIFVNPTQFGDTGDLDNYPRTLEADLELCRAIGVDMVFLPMVSDMYAEGEQTSVCVEPLGSDLIGRQRTGHFRGVTTVVSKLFNIVQPSRAYFGEKDFQQLGIIRRMVSDLFVPVEIVGVPTVRDADGLALSSRNARLDPAERAASVVLSKALMLGAALIEAGETEPEAVLSPMRAMIEAEPLADLKSLDIRSARHLDPVERIGEEPVVILVTAQFGSVLLIDQREARASGAGTQGESGR